MNQQNPDRNQQQSNNPQHKPGQQQGGQHDRNPKHSDLNR